MEWTHHGLLGEVADRLDGTRSALLEGDTVHLFTQRKENINQSSARKAFFWVCKCSKRDI